MLIRKILRFVGILITLYRCSCIKSPTAKKKHRRWYRSAILAGQNHITSLGEMDASRSPPRMPGKDGHPSCFSSTCWQGVLKHVVKLKSWMGWKLEVIEMGLWPYMMSNWVIYRRYPTFKAANHAVTRCSRISFIYIYINIYVYIIYKAYYISWITGASS